MFAKQSYPRIVTITHANQDFPTVVSDALPNEAGWFVIDEKGIHNPQTFSTNVANEKDPLLFMVHAPSGQLSPSEVKESVKRFVAFSPTHIDMLAFWDLEGWDTTKIFEIEREPSGKKKIFAKHSFAMAIEAIESFASQWD